MTDPFLCDNCNKNCPNSYGIRKSYFSTTAYDGKLCSIKCCFSWVLKNKKVGVQPKKVNIHEGELKIVHTKTFLM